jgi:hypothetical protein
MAGIRELVFHLLDESSSLIAVPYGGKRRDETGFVVFDFGANAFVWNCVNGRHGLILS